MFNPVERSLGMFALKILHVNAVLGRLLRPGKHMLEEPRSAHDRAVTSENSNAIKHSYLWIALSKAIVIVMIGVTCLNVTAQQQTPPMKDWWVHKFMHYFSWANGGNWFDRPAESFQSAQEACVDRLVVAQNPPSGICNYTDGNNQLWTYELDANGYAIAPAKWMLNCDPSRTYTTPTANVAASTCTIFDEEMGPPSNRVRVTQTEELYKFQCPVSMHYKSYKQSNQLYPGCVCVDGKQWNATAQSCVEICIPPKIYDLGTNSCIYPPCPKGTSQSPINPAACIADDNLPDPCKLNPSGPACRPKPENNPNNPPASPSGPGGGSGSQPDPDCPRKNPGSGNPIFPLTGVKVESVSTGMQIGGIPLTLTYDTSSRAPGSVSSLYSQLPSFGGIWFSSLHRRLTVADSRRTALLARGDGRILSFSGDGAGAFTTYDNLSNKLVSIAGGYRYQDDANMTQEVYNSIGQLTSLSTASGKQITFAYNAENDLIRVQDDTGRALQFEYAAVITDSPLKLISRIVDASAQTIVPAYDASNGNLSGLTWQDGIARQFLYENSNFPWALTGVADESTSRYSYFGYDSEGRAISTELSGGVGRYTVTYTQPPLVSVVDAIDANTSELTRTRSWQVPTGVLLTTPNGKSVDMGLEGQRGTPALTSLNQPAGSGCVASTSALVYDSNGNRTSKDDFAGKRSCFAYDQTRNLMNVSVDGLGNTVNCSSVLNTNASLPTGGRKFSTQLHPDWSLTTQSAEPLRIVTKVYNGQVDPFNGNAVASCAPADALTPDGKPIVVLCKQVVQATLDGNGSLGLAAPLDTNVAPRVSGYTYDARGRILTSTNSFNDTTTYTYYTATAFTGAGPSAVGFTIGDLQSITGPTGLVTTFNTYDKLGRILQRTDAKGIVTVISYTPRGWINTISVTPPGGTVRTTTYSYDNIGQVTGVSNPDGTTLSFAYDSAHRLYQATDARGNSVTYSLDGAGNRIGEQLTDPSGTLLRSIRRAFDDLNQMQQMQIQDTTPSDT